MTQQQFFRKIFVFTFVILFAGGVLFAANTGKSDMTRGSIELEAGKVRPQSEIQSELDAAGLDAGVELYINSNMVMLDSKSTANLLVQNSENNKNDQQIYIYCNDVLDDNGDAVCIYKSDIIPPGYKIESAKLLIPLGEGTHACRVSFHVLDADGQDKAEINGKINITVLS